MFSKFLRPKMISLASSTLINKQDLRLMFNIQGFLKIGIIPVIGDSMTPTIKEGEMIIFQDDGSMIEGGIYVIEYQVKSLQRNQESGLYH